MRKFAIDVAFFVVCAGVALGALMIGLYAIAGLYFLIAGGVPG